MNFDTVGDFKADYIKYFSLASASKELSAELVLVTNFGMIVGEYYDLSVPAEDIKLEHADDAASIHKILNVFDQEIFKMRDQKTTNVPDEEKYSKGIYVKNVKLYTGGNPINMPFLFVFFDQVVGVSFGNTLVNQYKD